MLDLIMVDIEGSGVTKARLMTKDQTIMGLLVITAIIAGATIVGTGAPPTNLGTGAPPTNPQAMCSSKEVEITLHKLWVDTLSGVSLTSVLGIPGPTPKEAQVLAPTPEKTEVSFVSDPIAVEYDKDLQRVTCQRQLTTNNGLMIMSMRVAGKNAITTNYSVQPGARGGYIVTILKAPSD
jgi:hypothetical protein